MEISKMSATKFTKREWEVVTEPESSHYLATIDCGGIMQIHVVTSATDITFAESIERLANAHLIACAPDMYEMLDTLIDSSNPEDMLAALIENKAEIESLLKRARGEKC